MQEGKRANTQGILRSSKKIRKPASKGAFTKVFKGRGSRRNDRYKGAQAQTGQRFGDKGKNCDHYHKPGHFRGNCWVLHPNLRRDKKNQDRFNKATAHSRPSLFNHKPVKFKSRNKTKVNRSNVRNKSGRIHPKTQTRFRTPGGSSRSSPPVHRCRGDG